MKKLIILLSLNILFAQVPHKMSFQAYLTDVNNMPINPGSYEMTFRIYDALTEGNLVWEENQTVLIEESLVSVMLGNTVPLTTLNSAGYLEIQLKDDILSPRQELGGTMFAIKAVNADTAKFVDLSNYNGLMRNVEKNDAHVTAYSTNANSASYLSLIAQDKDGKERELRIYNEGNNGGDFRFYDSTNDKDLMVLDTTGALTAVKFVGDGSQLTGIAKTTDTDDQTLSISGDTLYISEGNNVILTQYKDNTDTQDLSFNSSTNILSLTDGGTVDLSNLNTASGASSLDGLTDALVEDNSIYIGNNPSATTNEAINNIAIGKTSLKSITTGDNNVGVGNNTLSANTSGEANVAIGSLALETNTTGSNNVSLGNFSMYLNTTGSNNIAVGQLSLKENTTGGSNTAIGYGALSSSSTADKNTAVGELSLNVNTTGDKNTAVGASSLKANTTGSMNAALGQDALSGNTTGQKNTAIGYQALLSNTIGKTNTAIGYMSLKANTTSEENTAIGYATLYSNTDGEYNTAVGNRALLYNTTGDYNTAVGYKTLLDNTTGTSNIAVGNAALGETIILQLELQPLKVIQLEIRTLQLDMVLQMLLQQEAIM